MWELRSGVLVSVVSNCTGVHGVSGQHSQRARRQAILMADQRQFDAFEAEVFFSHQAELWLTPCLLKYHYMVSRFSPKMSPNV